ncbi:MAG: Uma2 family endonuclease [Actinomycetota bacterium]|nr:Uma2 family endonuclease [Actinomycetota bacterium]
MIALPLQRPRLLTVAEFAALPEDSAARYELQEGHVVMSPRPKPDHQECLGELRSRLKAQAPDGLDVLPEVDVDLELVPSGRPGFVRAPDLVVVPRDARLRVRTHGGLIRAGEVVLAVEIISPGTRRMDTVIKHGEYADAGIPHYWVIDIEGGVSLTACHLAGEFGYLDASPHTGPVTIDEPFTVRLDLDALL